MWRPFSHEASRHSPFEILHESLNHVFWDLSGFRSYCCLELFECLWVVCINFFLQVSPEKKKSGGEVRKVGRPFNWTFSADDSVSKSSLQPLQCLVSYMRSSPVLLKPLVMSGSPEPMLQSPPELSQDRQVAVGVDRFGASIDVLKPV